MPQKRDKSMTKTKNTAKTPKTGKVTERIEERLNVQFQVEYELDKKNKSSDKANKVAKTKLEGDNFFDFAENFGSGGVFIKTKTPQKVDEVLKINFTIPGTKVKVAVKGKVMWVQDSDVKHRDVTAGMGVSFLDLPNEKRQQIREYMNSVTSGTDNKVA